MENNSAQNASTKMEDYYEKRLITTNPSIKEQPYFSDRQINIISTPSDIKSIDWENFQPVPVPDCCKLDKYLSFLLSLS